MESIADQKRNYSINFAGANFRWYIERLTSVKNEKKKIYIYKDIIAININLRLTIYIKSP